MNKKTTISMLFSLLVLSVLSGCTMYQSKPGTIDQLEGTYELIGINKKDENNEIYDYKQENEIVAYFTVSKDGYGYYAYKDKETELKITPIYTTFVKDDDEEDKYKAIEITDGISDVKLWDKEVGCFDEPTMGFNKNRKTLSYTIPAQQPSWTNSNHEIHYQNVVYKKISKLTNLDTINDKFETNFDNLKPFEMSKLTGIFVGYFGDSTDNINFNKYNYVLLDMDSYDGNNVKLYYSEKSDNVDKVDDCKVSLVENENSVLKTVQIEVFGLKYSCACYYPNSLGNSFIYEEFKDGLCIFTNSFSKNYSNSSINELIEEYKNNPII